jgi:hypothetical protein
LFRAAKDIAAKASFIVNRASVTRAHAWQNWLDHRSAAMSSFNSFAEFYPFYLGEHSHPTCRRLHFIGSSLVIVVVLWALLSGQLRWLWLAPVVGYGFAWVGHIAFEKNRPATFKHPLYSLLGDWVMYGQMLRGKVSF